jgi:hypothetical protein
MKSLAKVCLVLTTALTLAAFTAQAQTDATSTAPAKPAPAKTPMKRYFGTIASVDNDAKTITVTLANGSSQTIHIGSKSHIKKDGEAATLADAAAGQKVRGTDHKDDAGNWVANTVNIGEPKPKAAASTPDTAAPAAPATK